MCGHKFDFAPIDSNLWPHIPQFVVHLKAPWIVLIVFYSEASIFFYMVIILICVDTNSNSLPIDSNVWPYIPQFVVPLKAPWIVLIVFYSEASIFFYMVIILICVDTNSNSLPIDSNLWPHIPQFVVPLKAPWIVSIVFYSEASIFFFYMVIRIFC